MAGEFATQFPKIASRLNMTGIDIADPYVERLLEGVSFLTARVQLKMDAEFPRFSQRLLEEPLREPRKLGIHFELHACGEETDSLQQPLDVGIRDVDSGHVETRRDLGKLRGEFARHLPEILELPVVVVEQSRIHDQSPRL